ncbi:hypothetical protein BC939DRAFT_300720 [Gamsiella multidivaricata]|uniref:uncharacterized protein n=1 Tax=Gamsiella multidivaricata TaxID=101098 RepID=UPI00221F7FFB|nr:uncharacterized protein BC939DRAFT_300720 [Gamsiella multidivaricata]KAI7818169.1 hypothetical protein BC939DRAFT_300720 [Gamsiella multidivaricata]
MLTEHLHIVADRTIVEDKIYMHGGNTTQTVATDSYAKDLWILDTTTWQWTSGPSSSFGRASHTLINTNNTLLSLSGFEFETSKTKAAQNAFVMVYDLGSSTWGAQFGVITQSFLQRHAVAIIGGSVAGFVLILVLASICARLWRKHTRRGLPTKVPAAAVGGGGRKRTTKPFLASTAPPNSGSGMATDCSAAVASRLSGMTLLSQNQNQGAFETQIDLSTVPRASESTIHDNYQYPQHRSYNPYAPTQQQQQVPLMSANALQQQDQEMDPYRDDDGLEERDMCLLSHSPPNSGGGEVPHMGSFVHAGQTTGVSGVPVRGQMAPSCTAAPNAGSTSGP